MGRRAGRARRRIGEYAALKGTLGAGARSAARGDTSSTTSSASSPTRSISTRRSSTTRTSATTRSTRGASRCRRCMARWQQATSWFSPELLTIPIETVRELDGRAARNSRSIASRSRRSSACRSTCSTSSGERLLSLSARLSGAPDEAYLRAVDGRREVSGSHAQHRREGHDVVRAVPRGAGDQPQPGRSARGVPRALRHVPDQPQHLRDALSRRLPARLVPRALARLPDDARRRAARQQHPAIGRRQPDRGDARRRRAAAALPPPAPQARSSSSATIRTTSRFRIVEWDRRYDYAEVLDADRRVGGAARRGLSGADVARDSASAGSTSTRTTASAAAPTRRPSTACIRTC